MGRVRVKVKIRSRGRVRVRLRLRVSGEASGRAECSRTWRSPENCVAVSWPVYARIAHGTPGEGEGVGEGEGEGEG